jgi:hypothetical protein
VRTHLENIYDKLGVSSHTAAVTRAFPERIGQDPPRAARPADQVTLVTPARTTGRRYLVTSTWKGRRAECGGDAWACSGPVWGRSGGQGAAHGRQDALSLSRSMYRQDSSTSSPSASGSARSISTASMCAALAGRAAMSAVALIWLQLTSVHAARARALISPVEAS